MARPVNLNTQYTNVNFRDRAMKHSMAISPPTSVIASNTLTFIGLKEKKHTFAYSSLNIFFFSSSTQPNSEYDAFLSFES